MFAFTITFTITVTATVTITSTMTIVCTIKALAELKDAEREKEGQIAKALIITIIRSQRINVILIIMSTTVSILVLL